MGAFGPIDLKNSQAVGPGSHGSRKQVGIIEQGNQQKEESGSHQQIAVASVAFGEIIGKLGGEVQIRQCSDNQFEIGL